MSENGTSTTPARVGITASDLFLPVVLSMVTLVFILTGIILVMCSRRIIKKRNRRRREEIITKTLTSQPFGYSMSSHDEVGIHNIAASSQRSRYACSSLSTYTGSDLQPVSRQTSNSSVSVISVNPPTRTQFDSTVPHVTIECERDSVSSYSERRTSDPPPVCPRPIETLEESRSPTLPRIRGRKLKTGVSNNSLIGSKADTLQRASNIFRSDTKAHKFYAQTMTNYEINPNHITSKHRIGRGHFGFVHQGIASKLNVTKRRNQQVAIKTMKNSAPDSDKQEFLYEVEIMRLVNSLNHPNIIKLLGCVTKTQPYMIILELMTNGNLQKFLRDSKHGDGCYYNLQGTDDTLTEQQLLKFALDIARGMEGIADLQLLHRDLATRNVLIDERFVCKVADFGFAKDVLNKPEYKSKSVFQRARPTRWLPPESLFQYKHCIQSDVWSYGIVLWEVVTMGNLPYPSMSTREVMRAIGDGYRMSCPQHCSPKLYQLMKDCWELDPSNRPTFSKLVASVEKLLQESKTRLPSEDSLIDMDSLTEDAYIDTLPPDDQEVCKEFASSETLC